MLNLQICSPYTPCPYKCPFCVVDNSKQEQFVNLFALDEQLYFEKLYKQVKTHQNIILTGSTEPTLFPDWLEKTIITLGFSKNKIELQTKNYNLPLEKFYQPFDFFHRINTLAYSITKLSELYFCKDFKRIDENNRLVILLLNDFLHITAEEIYELVKEYNQVTFKVLQKNKDTRINEYIEKNKIKDISPFYKIADFLNKKGISTRIDLDCQNATNRYDIFRIDGNIYHEW